MDIAQKFAQTIKVARLAANMTQQEVADKADLTVNYYARIERAEVKPTIETVEKISNALGIKICFPLPNINNQ